VWGCLLAESVVINQQARMNETVMPAFFQALDIKRKLA